MTTDLRAAIEALPSPDPTFPSGYYTADMVSRAAVLALLDAAPAPGLDVAWAEAEAALPDGWLFHGVELADHSMDGGLWGPDWQAAYSWPGHCEYADCDHDEAFRVALGETPLAALRALAAFAPSQPEPDL